MEQPPQTRLPTRRPWYHAGLHFQCTGCGDCCTGDPGYVWVSEEEIASLAVQVALDVEEFERDYVRHLSQGTSLIERPNGDCVFFDSQTRRCTVYQWRPRQCRTWPFWRSNLQSRQAWEQTCRVCPGCGRGPLVPLDEIVSAKKAVRI